MALRDSAGADRRPATPYPVDTLGMDAETLRRLGYRIVDAVVDRLANRDAEPAIRGASPEVMTAALGGALPERPSDPDRALDRLIEVALAHQQHGDHPRYFARVPGPSSAAGVLGDWLGTGFNAIASSWGGAAGPATIELVAVDWLRQLIGLPDGTEGVLVSGGSLANLTAIAVARNEVGQGAVYLTDQTHSSIVRDLKLLGYTSEDIRVLASDEQFRMPMDALDAAIARDKGADRKPSLVIASAGTTNTGAVDPLAALADLCRREGLWLHVDGAYGAPAAATETGRAVLAGLDRADSVVLDPHKWVFQPYDCGAVFVTRPGALERCFTMRPEYLRDVQTASGAVNFGERSPELTRRARALKLWLTFRTYGAERLRAAIAHGIGLAEFAESYLSEQPDSWTIVSPAQLGIVCFAFADEKRQRHEERARIVSESGFACVTSTSLKGRSALRLCLINPLTTQDDVRETIDRLAVAV